MRFPAESAGNWKMHESLEEHDEDHEDLHPTFPDFFSKVPEMKNEHSIRIIRHHTSRIHKSFMQKHQNMLGSKELQIYIKTLNARIFVNIAPNHSKFVPGLPPFKDLHNRHNEFVN